MPILARYLQDEFGRHCPAGWACRPEAAVVGERTRRMLGYSPQADILLEEAASGRRIWVELEVSRADPVANHAKFAAAHLVEPLPPTNAFVSMVSRHVDRGRANLAAHTVGAMRALGMRAFQTLLLPRVPKEEIKRCNHLRACELDSLAPDIRPELQRVMAVVDALSRLADSDIHFAANPVEVLFNVHRWNSDLADPAQREAWGRRRVRYFAADPTSGLFAPSKFAAYIRLPRPTQHRPRPPSPTPGLTGMSLRSYAGIDAAHPIFDGNRAWHHLRDLLGFTLLPLDAADRPTAERFLRWLEHAGDAVQVDAKGPMLLLPLRG